MLSRKDLALACTHGDESAATSLITLIESYFTLENDTGSSISIPCPHYREGYCYINIPDSVVKCTIPCEFCE